MYRFNLGIAQLIHSTHTLARTACTCSF